MRHALLVLTLAGCGGKSAAPPTTPSNTDPTPVTPAEPVVTAGGLDPAVCAQRPDELGPVMLAADQLARRYGTGATKYSDALTTKDKPIEVCGIPAQRAWLRGVTCADGTNPYPDDRAVAGSRAGNVGPGGVCGSIIDLYIATCPEQKYEVHIDMYMCGPDESFM